MCKLEDNYKLFSYYMKKYFKDFCKRLLTKARNRTMFCGFIPYIEVKYATARVHYAGSKISPLFVRQYKMTSRKFCYTEDAYHNLE